MYSISVMKCNLVKQNSSLSLPNNLAILGVMAITTSCACMSSRMWNYHLFDHWVMYAPYCSIASVHSNLPLFLPRPLNLPTEQIHNTRSFSRAFSVWVHWVCLLWACGCGGGVLTYVLHVNIYHDTTLLELFLSARIRTFSSNPQTLRRNILVVKLGPEHWLCISIQWFGAGHHDHLWELIKDKT